MSVFKFMTVTINYKKETKKKSSNLVLFVDENFKISNLKKYLSSSEHSFISDLMTITNKKKEIVAYDISSKKKIILIALKKKNDKFCCRKLRSKIL